MTKPSKIMQVNMSPNKFTFEISLSVLNHLGRNLYRNFVTVLGEAISNSWDADAENVQIYIDRKKDCFFIKDDGTGMTTDDFQEKFLKIGYSKREGGKASSLKGRPYIGRKGIGKLALLSCAEKITVATKTRDGEYAGGSINNSGLDQAIKDDLEPGEYPLEELQLDKFAEHMENHEQGTIICFENIRGGIKNRLDYLKKMTALYFRFSLYDNSFNIFINDDKITLSDLNSLAQNTSFLWNINNLEDPFITEQLSNLEKPVQKLSMDEKVKGFVASVQKPSNLKMPGVDERVSVDLFVNGRLRERDILKHIPTSRIVENYLYGQIHFDEMDKEKDRFTSSREGIVADDQKYKDFLTAFSKKILPKIMYDWDEFRLDRGEDGDPENEIISKEKRQSLALFNIISKQYKPAKASENKRKVDGWIKELGEEAAFNFESYADCFISENLIRKYITEKNLPLSKKAEQEIKQFKDREEKKKQEQDMHIDIRKDGENLGYLSMYSLAKEAKTSGVQINFLKDAKEYTPIRDAVAHTAFLTKEAKQKLTTVYNNIRAGVQKLLS